MLPGDPVWLPTAEDIANANITEVATSLKLSGLEALHRWSVKHRSEFWTLVADRLGIIFRQPAYEVLSGSAESPTWFAGARLNIVESCFRHDPNRVALITNVDDGTDEMTYGELELAVNRFANGFSAAGLVPGDHIALAMPMTAESVIAYLGIILAGGVVVSIADSFAATEIATRLRIARASVVVTQDRIVRGGKELPMYAKVVTAGAERVVVVDTGGGIQLRDVDIWWDDFQSSEDLSEAFIADPRAHTNVLFSSGTTGDPKAIPWDHITPLKGAMDAHFHLDVHSFDTLAWPTNLGWMMGPWLIYSALLNGAAFALYDDLPTGRGFAEFIDAAGVTMLGVIPSIVTAWRAGNVLEGLEWRTVRRFASTGEVSNSDDMTWLMSHHRIRPVLEYIGGTEIGGGFLAGSMVQPATPSTFSTITLGLDLVLLDEAGRETDSGELFLLPPSIGLSTELINRDHNEVYYKGTPGRAETLRRHGDHIERLPGGYFRAHGRIDDTMNLGGIKVSSAELERVVSSVAGVSELAAIAVTPDQGGPSRLVIYAVPEPDHVASPSLLKIQMQAAIRQHLNPLFKVDDVVMIDSLPRTASQKVVRRQLRENYRTS